MGDLKPIGSEKLTGQDKINRIMEIARFKESIPTFLNETAKSEYSISLADGNEYHVVKEKSGYVLKKTISESEMDYIEPMKNRKYYSSYSQAFKRLNLLAGELNRLNENNEGVSLFGEQKKFVLKTPKPAQPEMSEPPVPSEPPSVPSPELPPPPTAGEEGLPMDEPAMDSEMGMDTEDPSETGFDNMQTDEDGGPVSFKTVQKLTGKLTQKIRDLDKEDGMTSEDIKYVINMVLSSFNLSELSDEDKDDILSKFEEEEMGSEEAIPDMGSNEEPSDMGMEEPMPDMGMEEPTEGYYGGAIMDSIFSESKIDKVLSKYFESNNELVKEEAQLNKFRLAERKEQVKKLIKPVFDLSVSKIQATTAKRFLEENHNFVFVGKTNKRNLVFENKDRQVKISPNGRIL
jgi:hypothetical protein